MQGTHRQDLKSCRRFRSPPGPVAPCSESQHEATGGSGVCEGSPCRGPGSSLGHGALRPRRRPQCTLRTPTLYFK